MRLRTVLLPTLLLAACVHATATPSAIPHVDVAPGEAEARCEPFVEKTDAGAPEDPGPPQRVAEPSNPSDTCAVADSNLAKTEKAILSGEAGAIISAHPWEPHRAPERFDLVNKRLLLTKVEREKMAANGFVVRSQGASATYAWAFHDVYQSQLPVYVSADAILHAIYISNDQLIADIERTSFAPRLEKALAAMHCALAAGKYPPDIAHDVDLYLTVARSLLADRPIASVFGNDAEAGVLTIAAKSASGLGELDLFGRHRLIDWSQYQPRGHYTTPELTPFFRGAMWLGRLEFNLVSRSSRSSLLGAPDPRETPREAIAALALADTAERAGMLAELAPLDRTWTLLAGRREDVSLADLAALRKRAGIGAIDLASYDRLKSAIGDGFPRTARFHPMPEGSTNLPVIATMLGPRVVADAAAFRSLANTEVSGRYAIGAGDIAYVLGLDRGRAYLKDDLSKFPALSKQLDVARSTIANAPDAGDLYMAWLGGIRAAAGPTEGAVPSFMKTEAYEDLRMSTVVAAYGQLRHNYVLIAGQAYDEGGCVIPDGYLEPRPALYHALADYAARGKRALAELDPQDGAGTQAYFSNVERLMHVLETIAKHELEGRALTTDERNFFSMIVEMLPGSTGSAPSYTGWYFDLFRGRETEALAPAHLVADYYTSSYTNRVFYAGAHGPRLGIFVVDTGGPPRLAVGPVSRGFTTTSTLDKRYDDNTELPTSDEPWSASYLAVAPAAPEIAAGVDLGPDGDKTSFEIHLRSATALHVTIELLDHHGVAKRAGQRDLLAKTPTVMIFPRVRGIEGFRVSVGEFHAEDFVAGPSSYVRIESGGFTLDE